MKNSILNKINIKGFKDQYKVRIKLFPLHKNIMNSLSVPIRQILNLSFGRVRGLSNRVISISKFLQLVLRLKENHGTDFTIKWLKCCYVALQKSLGKDNLSSLRDLEPDLPLPRLINGVPFVIGSRDRFQIRLGNKSVIILWSSMFSIYRVLKCSYKLKISTITDPFKGDLLEMEKILRDPFRVYFDKLEGFSKLKKFILVPQRLRLLRSASPSNRVSWHGIVTDSLAWKYSGKVSLINDYLAALRSLGFSTKWIGGKLNELMIIGERLNEVGAIKQKCKMVNPLSQFSLKEEAAGKLRIFALVDSITQSLLSPMHDYMFSVLRLIPNDGTFDQGASVKRSQSKATAAGCAWSFDLSAATDRLPVILTSKIIGGLFDNLLIGEAWKNLLVNRGFSFTADSIEKYDAPSEELQYSVGQPMGALSSWPALAITHHWILQYCSSLLGRTAWEESYEILGDDLVIFDPLLAQKYLEITKILGVEINLSKSISSPNLPVFEFAKRTCWGENDLSPISMKQLLSRDTLSERINNFVNLLERGLITRKSLLGISLSKFGTPNFSNREKWKNPLLAILGVLHSKEVIPHRWLVEPLIDPEGDLEIIEEFTLPHETVVKLIVDIGKRYAGKVQPVDILKDIPYPFSDEETRKEVYKDNLPEFANIIANSAYTKAKALEVNIDDRLEKEARQLYAVEPSLAPVEVDLKASILGWFSDLLYDQGQYDVLELVDSIESNKKFYYRQMGIEDALAIEKQVDAVLYNYELTPKKRNVVKNESASIIKTLAKLVGKKVSNYLRFNRPDW